MNKQLKLLKRNGLLVYLFFVVAIPLNIAKGESFKKTFFHRTPLVTASDYKSQYKKGICKTKNKILTLHKIIHCRRVNFERQCWINGQKGTNVEHSFQNNSKQKIFLSVIIYHINRYFCTKWTRHFSDILCEHLYEHLLSTQCVMNQFLF